MQSRKTYTAYEAIEARQALRILGGLEPETFPVEAFVGMISDEIEHLRNQGRSDEEIARFISTKSAIQITAAEISENYASPERRHGTHG